MKILSLQSVNVGHCVSINLDFGIESLKTDVNWLIITTAIFGQKEVSQTLF